MKKELDSTDFNFKYTGSNFTEQEIIAKGYKLLEGEALEGIIRNTTIFGDYIMGYKFATDIYDNGTTEGVNDVGSQDFGNWSIDYKKNTLQLIWEKGWFDTITRAYDVDGNVEFYDVDTGKWRTTFRTFEKWIYE